MGRAWIDPALSAQLFQQQQQYMQNLSAAAESPSATESNTSGDRQNTEPSSPEDPVEAATESNGADQRNDEEMEPSNEVPNAANNDWLLQMYQKTREVPLYTVANCNYIFIQQVFLARRQRRDRNFRSSSQGITCPPVYNTWWMLHTVPISC